jgi:hypothetical protein
MIVAYLLRKRLTALTVLAKIVTITQTAMTATATRHVPIAFRSVLLALITPSAAAAHVFRLVNVPNNVV